LSFSWLVRNGYLQAFQPVVNYKTLGLDLDMFINFLIVLIVGLMVYSFGFLKEFTVASLFILVGVYSNFLEKLLYNNVLDYFDIYLAKINLADIQLWLGLIALNWQSLSFSKIFFKVKRRISKIFRIN
jgi:lipoprotein signal peptidase